MTFIYALVSGQLVLYVGQTKECCLKHREKGHRSKSNMCSTRHIPNYIDWTIQLLEEVSEDQETIKEQYYYDLLKPLYNAHRPGQTMKEYDAKRNKEKRNEMTRLRYTQPGCNRKEQNKLYKRKKKSEQELSTTN